VSGFLSFNKDTDMFDNLTDRLGSTLKKIKGQGRLTESNIKETYVNAYGFA